MGTIGKGRRLAAVWAIASLGSVPLAVEAGTGFAPGTSHDSGVAPQALAVADFNGDGKPDIAISFNLNLPGNNGKVGIQLNNGTSLPFPLNCTPTPCEPASGAYQVGKNPGALGTGVFRNALGRVDIAVLNRGDSTVSILFNDGTGHFAVQSTTLATGANPQELLVADFNGDGKLDIAVTNFSDNNVSIFLGNGDGTFTAATPATRSTGAGPVGLDAADMDGDGKIDLIVANYTDASVSFHKGNGDGTFQADPSPSFTSFNNPVRVKAGFFDGDNHRDVAVVMQDSDPGDVSGTPGGFEVLLGNGAGSFAASPSRRIRLDYASRFAVGRWDGDFVNDVALIRAVSSSNNILTYKGTASASYSPLNDVFVDFIPLDIAVGDFDGDGATDIAVIAADSGSNNHYLKIFRKLPEAPVFTASAVTVNTTVTQPVSFDLKPFLDEGLPYPNDWHKKPGSILPSLPNGLTLTSAGVITGAPDKGMTQGSPFSFEVEASLPGTGSASKVITINIAKSAQAIAFDPPDMPWTPNPVALAATTPALGGSFTFASLTTAVCTVSGSQLTVLKAGTCSLTAQHSGDNDFLASSIVGADVEILHAAQSITFSAPNARRLGDGAFTFGTTNNGSASASSTLAVTLGSATPLVCTVSGSTVTPGSAGTCQITLDQPGDTRYAAATQKIAQFEVDPNSVPGAPLLGITSAGDHGVTLNFSAPTDNGGAAVLDYTATCNPGTKQGTNATSPVTVAGLTNGTLYSCSVKARNNVGSGAASSAVNLTPAVAPGITSGNSTTFTRNAFNTFPVTRSGDPQPTLSVSFGSLPNGVALDANTGALSGTPALGSSTIYNIQVSATNAGGIATQNFTLNVPRFTQAISFTKPANQSFGTAAVPLSATTPAGTVTFTVMSPPAICELATATSVTTHAVGTCTIQASQNGNVDYEQAPSVSQSFDITAVAPGAPTNVQGTASNGAAFLTFTPPANNGGAAIQFFTGTCNPGNHTGQNSNPNVTVAGLTNGTTYACSVQASNSAGAGAASATVQVTPGVGDLQASEASHDFGNVSMGTTSPAATITFTNNGSAAVTVTSISSTGPPFSLVSHDCSTVAGGASCTAQVAFQPAIGAGGLLSIDNATGGLLLNLANNASSCCLSVMLTGRGEKSLVSHYYRAILGRAPDAGGKQFWEGEAVRVSGLGANVNETWFSMANFFFTSAEYVAFNRDDAGYTTDLYNTFFNRPPDPSGLAFWTGQLGSGMPRGVVLVSFMMSTEFATFTQNIFGNTAARAEVDTVVDFYRGLLARLPDTGGFNNWVQLFRAAQCSGAASVYAQVEAISSQFANGPEYTGKNRSNLQYVGDLYNAFLRRGGDLGGVQFWIGQLDTQARTRENVRQQFIASAEFQGRVTNIVNQGCLP